LFHGGEVDGGVRDRGGSRLSRFEAISGDLRRVSICVEFVSSGNREPEVAARSERLVLFLSCESLIVPWQFSSGISRTAPKFARLPSRNELLVPITVRRHVWCRLSLHCVHFSAGHEEEIVSHSRPWRQNRFSRNPLVLPAHLSAAFSIEGTPRVYRV